MPNIPNDAIANTYEVEQPGSTELRGLDRRVSELEDRIVILSRGNATRMDRGIIPNLPVPLLLNNSSLDQQVYLLSHTVRPIVTTLSTGREGDLILLEMHHQQTSAGASQMYGIKIITDTDVVDTGAGVAIYNIGHSDSIYLNVAGKSGNAASNIPTGIGIDLNKEIASSSERASANSSQQGIQIFDWSTTNQSVGGPRGLLIQKVGNLNTDHFCMTLRANRNMQQMIVVTGDAGYNGGMPVWRLDDETTLANLISLTARGEFVFGASGIGVQWVTPGSKTAYIMASTNDLKLKSGGTGIRLVNQADTQTGLIMQDNLDLVMGLAGSTSATAGFPHIPAHAGPPTGAPTTYAGWAPMVYDSTNDALYIYRAGWKVVATTGTGVTNGNSHDHNGGDGAQINHTTLSNIGTNTHAQVDTHLAASAPHSGHYKSGDSPTFVTITANKIVLSGLSSGSRDGIEIENNIYQSGGYCISGQLGASSDWYPLAANIYIIPGTGWKYREAKSGGLISYQNGKWIVETNPTGSAGGSVSTFNRVLEMDESLFTIKGVAVAEKGVSVGTGTDANVTFIENSSNPTAPSGADRFRQYMKGDKLVIQFKDAGGTMHYFTLDLTQSGATATIAQSSSAP